MNRKILIFGLLVLTLILAAQNETGLWSNIRNSAVTADGEILLRCETDPIYETEFLYRNDDDMWHSQSMELFQGTTHQTSFPYSDVNPNYCRFKTSVNDFITMMPAFVPENSIPATIDILGFIASDPQGDAGSVTDLDIINTFMGYSEEKIFAGIQNVTGSYPTNSGGVFPSEYYLYISGFINVETAFQDTVMYGIVYADIPVLFSSGLYKITGTEFSLDSIQKIGDVTHNIVDDVLVLACHWEDLIEDEHFGEWPSFSNTLGFQFMTQTINLNMELNSADETTPSMQTFKQYVIEPFVNILPEISNVGYSINNGNSTIWFDYFDENGHFPLSAYVQVYPSVFTLQPTSFDYSQPVTYTTTFPYTNWEEGLIRVSDNNIDYVEQEVIVTSTQLEVLPLVHNAKVYPNPFNPETSIHFSLHENQFVSVDIFDSKGRKRENLWHGFAEKGEHSLIWKAENHTSGLYFIRIQAEKDTQVLKTVLLK